MKQKCVRAMKAMAAALAVLGFATAMALLTRWMEQSQLGRALMWLGLLGVMCTVAYVSWTSDEDA